MRSVLVRRRLRIRRETLRTLADQQLARVAGGTGDGETGGGVPTEDPLSSFCVEEDSIIMSKGSRLC